MIPWLTDGHWPPGLERFVLDWLSLRDVLALRLVDR
jgi:hypothetical protein